MKLVPWNKYETVLLIDAYIQVSEGKETKSSAIHRISKALRALANADGQEIDDIFRNENGITMQMANIDYLFTNGRKGLHGYSNIFKEYVGLYKEDRASFNEILKEAKRMLCLIDFDESTQTTQTELRDQDKNLDSIDEEIIRIISSYNGGIKARHIAKKLKLTRKDVNSRIYSKMTDRLEQDKNYRWKLKSTEQTAEKTIPKDETKDDIRSIPGATFASVYHVDADKFKSTPIEGLSLNHNTINNLRSHSIRSIDTLLSKTEDDLMALSGFGRTKLNDVNKALRLLAKQNNNCSKSSNNDSSVNSNIGRSLSKHDLTFSEALSIPRNIEYVNVSISDLGLGNKAKGLLLRAKIKSLYQLLETPVENVKSLQGMGAGTMHQISNALSKYSVKKETIDRKSLIQLYTKSLFDELTEDADKTRRMSETLRNALIGFSVRTDLYEDLKKIPEEHLNNPSSHYIKAFHFVFTKSDIVEEASAAQTLRQMIESCIQNENVNPSELAAFIRLCSYDYVPGISAVIPKILNDQKTTYIVKSRMSGMTLEQTSEQLNITRERVRQIERKSKTKFLQYLASVNFFERIVADHCGYKVFKKEVFSEYFGENLDIALFLATDKNGMSYSKTYDLYSISASGVIGYFEEFINKLPDSFSENTLDIKYNRSIIKNSISFDTVHKIISSLYLSTGNNTYSKSKLSFKFMFSVVLDKYYPQGLHISDSDEIAEFKERVKETFGNVKMPASDRALGSIIQREGILCGRGRYKTKGNTNIPVNLKNKLERYISKSKRAVYVNTLFTIYEQELRACGIDNKYYLYGVLRELFEDKFYFKRDYVSKNKKIYSYSEQIQDYILLAGTVVTKQELQNEFKGISDIMIQLAVAGDEIINYVGGYLHGENLKVYSSDKKYFIRVINEMLQKQDIVTSEQVYSLIRNDRPDIVDRMGIFYSYTMFSVLKYLLEEKYTFQRPFIAKIGAKIDRPVTVINTYLSDKETVEVDSFLEEVKRSGYRMQSILSVITSFNKTHLLCDKHKMVKIEKIGINDDSIRVIEADVLRQIGTETKAIRDLNLEYTSYNLNIPVSEWLVFSILDKYSDVIEVAAPGLFKEAIPLLSRKGYMDTSVQPDSKMSYLPGDMDDSEEDFDDLILELFEDELLEDEI